MKYTSIAAFLFCLINSVANAQPVQHEKIVLCDKTAEMFEALGKQYQEVPVWGGKNSEQGLNFALMLNTETKTWTLVQFNTKTACILGIGDDYVTR